MNKTAFLVGVYPLRKGDVWEVGGIFSNLKRANKCADSIVPTKRGFIAEINVNEEAPMESVPFPKIIRHF